MRKEDFCFAYMFEDRYYYNRSDIMKYAHSLPYKKPKTRLRHAWTAANEEMEDLVVWDINHTSHPGYEYIVKVQSQIKTYQELLREDYVNPLLTICSDDIKRFESAGSKNSEPRHIKKFIKVHFDKFLDEVALLEDLLDEVMVRAKQRRIIFGSDEYSRMVRVCKAYRNNEKVNPSTEKLEFIKNVYSLKDYIPDEDELRTKIAGDLIKLFDNYADVIYIYWFGPIELYNFYKKCLTKSRARDVELKVIDRPTFRKFSKAVHPDKNPGCNICEELSKRLFSQKDHYGSKGMLYTIELELFQELEEFTDSRALAS